MSVKEKVRHIFAELKGHAPFTLLGASLGIIFMIVFHKIGELHAVTLFRIFHPTHVILSAMVTASLFSLHEKKKHFLIILLVGYFGSVGIATFSDSIIPFFGGNILGIAVPVHSETHAHNETQDIVHKNENEEHKSHLHLGFIEEWYLVTPAAILGVIIAYFLPRTKFPHTGHILISTWASLSHIMMNTHTTITPIMVIGIFIVLFIAVWVPCCVSDIVFPMLFVKPDLELAEKCPRHSLHSHNHKKPG